jgi:phosphoglycolate phosphatase
VSPSPAAPLLVFDLDGTLVDALPDLTAALNRMLAARGLAPLPPADVRPMIGDGTTKLIERALAARGAIYADEAERGFLADYTAHVAVESRPFPGVNATLARLQEGASPSAPTNRPPRRKRCSRRSISHIGSRRWAAATASPRANPIPRISPPRSNPPAARVSAA